MELLHILGAADLLIEDRAAIISLHADCRDEKDRRRHDQQNRRTDKINRPLPEPLPERQRIFLGQIERRVHHMDLGGSVHQNIRYFGQHIHADAVSVAVFDQLISLRRRDLPQNDRAIVSLLNGSDHRFCSLTGGEAARDPVPLRVRGEFCEHIRRRPVPVDEQHAAGREHPPVDKIRQVYPDDGHQHLQKEGAQHRPDRNDPVPHQRNLKIGDNVRREERENLRQNHIKRLAVPDIIALPGAGKEHQEQQINDENQGMATLIKFQLQPDQRIVHLKPYPCIEAGLQQQTKKAHLQRRDFFDRGQF